VLVLITQVYHDDTRSTECEICQYYKL